jgi:hypothetical protein
VAVGLAFAMPAQVFDVVVVVGGELFNGHPCGAG